MNRKEYLQPQLTTTAICADVHLLTGSVKTKGDTGITVLDETINDSEAGSRRRSVWDDEEDEDETI